MTLVIWAGGRLRDESEPVIGATDHGLMVGDGVFETCEVTGGGAFALTRHLQRLEANARALGLAPVPTDEVRSAVAAVLDAGGSTLGRLRITVTAGPGPMGSGRGDAAPTLVVVAGPGRTAATARVVRVPWARNERSAIVGLKTTSYAENVVAMARAVAAGADEALFANTRDELCEGTGSNVFVELDGELLTPSLESGCLAGISRALLLEWAAQEGLPVREVDPAHLPYRILDDISAGRGALALTSSTRQVVPVVSLDGVELAVGAVSQAARELFRVRAALDVDP
jgi:branched-chain amino acid aminotransferase